MSEKAPNIVDAIKATAEMCGIFMEHLKEQGFSRKEALDLTQVFLGETLRPKQNTKNKEDF